MDIVLDSNIYRNDILLRSKDIEILLDYITKTESNLIIPQIIYEEIIGLYERTLTERIVEFKKSYNNLNLMLTEKVDKLSLDSIDVNAESSKYENFIRNKLKVKENFIIKYQNDFLPEISRRAINRQKPCGEKGQGFRDALIWLTIIDYCRVKKKQLVFISNNTEDFANSAKNDLHENLKNECESEGVKIHYYTSIKEFIDKHSTRIDFIDKDWISANLDNKEIETEALNELNRNSKRDIHYWFQRVTGNICEYYNVLNVNIYDKDNPTVYEMLDNRLIVNIVLSAEFEIEFDYYIEDSEYFNYHDEHPSIERSFVSRIHYINAQIYVSLTVKNNEVVDYELTDIGF